NGWMHELEEQVRPFLGPLIAGGTGVLAPNEQRLLARWAAKTVLALDLTRPLGVLPADDYQWVRRRLTPPKTMSRIWAIAYAGNENGWKFVRHGLHYGQTETGSEAAKPINGYLTTLRVGHVCLQVFGKLGVAKDYEPWESPEMQRH